MNIEIRMQPAASYLTETRLVGSEELPEFIQTSGLRLLDRAARVGGAVGPITVFYPEQISKEVDGHVTNGVPITIPEGERRETSLSDTDDPFTGAEILREGLCELALVKIPKSQVNYPDILTAYDDVFAWIEAKDYRVSGAPREIYFADPSDAADSDLVCEVAVPFVRNS